MSTTPVSDNGTPETAAAGEAADEIVAEATTAEAGEAAGDTPETAFEAGGELVPRGQGALVIADFVKRLPNAPGVYRMFDRSGNVLYVGKARNLKARVSNYAKIGGQTQRIARMISLTRFTVAA